MWYNSLPKELHIVDSPLHIYITQFIKNVKKKEIVPSARKHCDSFDSYFSSLVISKLATKYVYNKTNSGNNTYKFYNCVKYYYTHNKIAKGRMYLKKKKETHT